MLNVYLMPLHFIKKKNKKKKRSMAGSSRKVFDDIYTVLEFIGETSEASEDDIHALFEALPLDWEATPPAPAPPMPAVENSTFFCTRYFAAND